MSKASFYWLLEMGISVVVVNLPPIWTAFDAARPDGRLPSVYASLDDEESN